MKASTDIIGEAFKKMHDQQSRRDNVMRELERLQKAAKIQELFRGNDIRLDARNETAQQSLGYKNLNHHLMSGCNRKSRDHITNIASRGGREGAWRRPVSINPDGTVDFTDHCKQMVCPQKLQMDR